MISYRNLSKLYLPQPWPMSTIEAGADPLSTDSTFTTRVYALHSVYALPPPPPAELRKRQRGRIMSAGPLY